MSSKEHYEFQPFKNIDKVLSNLDVKASDRNIAGADVQETIEESRKYLEQARRFLKGAEYYSERNAYNAAEVAWDDFKQKATVLHLAYSDVAGCLEEPIDEVDEMKRNIDSELEGEAEVLSRRFYETIYIGLEEFDQINYCLRDDSLE